MTQVSLKEEYRKRRQARLDSLRDNPDADPATQQAAVDNALSSIYGPISDYVDPQSLYDVFASTYGEGRTARERDITGFDPADWAEEKQYGSGAQRRVAVRGSRKRVPGPSGDEWHLAQIDSFTGERILGYDEYSEYFGGKTGAAPNAFDDYFYDLALQEGLQSRVTLGVESQGDKGYFGKKKVAMQGIRGLLEELEILIPDETARKAQLDDVKSQAIIKATGWAVEYKKDTLGKIEPALEAVESRQNVLDVEGDVRDLNKVIKARKRLDKTKAALNKVSPTHSTGVRDKFPRVVGAIENTLEATAALIRKTAVDMTVGTYRFPWESGYNPTREVVPEPQELSTSTRRELEESMKKRDEEFKKKAPRNKGLPAEIVDTGIPNYSGVQTIKVHKDIADSLDKAMSNLTAQGVDLQIEDSFRYRTVQAEQYEASKGGVKAGLVAHPDSSYHVKGLAFDLAQIDEMRNDPRVADALTNAGFVRPRDDEWWHWSIQD